MSQAIEQEIRALRAHFWSARDPEGRAFAPLADAYRRRGELDEAHSLVEDGLARLPDFTPGHLVAARIHRARGDLERARTSLDALLALDAENVLALLDRAELSRDTGDRDLAVRDLSALLNLVPGHLGARSALDALEREGGGEAGTSDPPEEPSRVGGTGIEGTSSGTDPEALGIEDRWPAEEIASDLDLVSNDLDLENFATDEADAPGELMDFETTSLEDDRRSTDDPNLEDPGRMELDPGIASSADDADPPLGAGGPPALPGVSGELDADADVDAFDFDLGFDAGVTAASNAGEGLPAHVTRTMAEIFVRQGFPDRAIEVYEQILEREPGDEGILGRIAELKGEVEASDQDVTTAAGRSEPSDEDEPALEKLAPQWAGSESDPETDVEPVTAFGWSDDESEHSGAGEASEPPDGTEMAFDPRQASIRSHFDDLLAWVPGAVPIEDLAPDAPLERAPAGSPAAAGALPRESASDAGASPGTGASPGAGASADAPAGRDGVEPTVPPPRAEETAVPPSQLPAERVGGDDPERVEPAEEDEDLDDFRSWLESLEP